MYLSVISFLGFIDKNTEQAIHLSSDRLEQQHRPMATHCFCPVPLLHAVSMDPNGHSYFHPFATARPLPKHRQVTEDRKHLVSWAIFSLPFATIALFSFLGDGFSGTLFPVPWPQTLWSSALPHGKRPDILLEEGRSIFENRFPTLIRPHSKVPKEAKISGAALCSCRVFPWEDQSPAV